MAAVPVVIAVLTYRRTDDLASMLGDLAAHVAGSSVDASILVVDNDHEPSARGIVAGALGVRYVHERRPGIAAARNRALDESAPDRLLIFIDDDERPRPGWLDALVSTWGLDRPAAVVGPVVSQLSVPPDPWINAGGYFQRLRHATGTSVPVAATNNLLIDLDVVRSMGLRFDERFGLSGGSDYFFTRSLVKAGGRIIWCDEAIVTDVVPPERITREWVLRRAVRMGNTESRATVLLERRGPRRWVARSAQIGRATLRLAAGGARASFGMLSGRATHAARGARTAARGRGMLLGALGRVVVEYGRPAPGEPFVGRRPSPEAR